MRPSLPPLLLLLAVFLTGCAGVPELPAQDDFAVPPPPDYSLERYWAALPTTVDQADRTPGPDFKDRQATAPADVFYIHPTIYSDTRGDNDLWNASLEDEKLNRSVDDRAILNQASIFNAAGRVYAPRYRQAHIRVFYPEGRPVAEQALDTAYNDIRAAFRYYLTTYNQGRPIIIAGHSQGTLHAKRLVDEFFDGRPLYHQLVAAYLVGMPGSQGRGLTEPTQVGERTVVPCDSARQTGCFVSWRTYREDYVARSPSRVPSITVNPLTWRRTTELVPASENKGGVLYDYDSGPKPELVSAQVRADGLYVSKPSFFGDIFFNTKNYHIGDYNLFWVNVRENAVERVEAYVEGRGASQ